MSRIVQYTFPMGDKRRIQLPPFPGKEGLGSLRLICPRERIRPWDPDNEQGGADADGFWPIQAVFLCVIPIQLPGCGQWPSYVNDGISRCAILLDSVWLVDQSDDLTVPLTVDFKVKVAGENVGTPLKTVSVTFTKADVAGTVIQKTGIIVEVSGVLGNQFELWARTNPSAGGLLRPIDVALQFIVDRIGDRIGAFVGPIAGGGELPTVNP